MMAVQKNSYQIYVRWPAFASVATSFRNYLYFRPVGALRCSSVFCINLFVTYNSGCKKLTFTLAKTVQPHCLRSLTIFCCIFCFCHCSTWNILLILNFNYGEVSRVHYLQGLYQRCCVCGQQCRGSQSLDNSANKVFN